MAEWKAAAAAKSKAELAALEAHQQSSGDWRSKAEEKLTIEFREAVQARILAEAQASAEVCGGRGEGGEGGGERRSGGE